MNRQKLLITKRRLRQLCGDFFITQTVDQKTNIIINQICKDWFLFKSKELINDVQNIVYLAYENMLLDQNSDYKGFTPSPLFGKVLNFVYELQIDEEINSYSTLLNIAIKLIQILDV